MPRPDLQDTYRSARWLRRDRSTPRRRGVVLLATLFVAGVSALAPGGSPHAMAPRVHPRKDSESLRETRALLGREFREYESARYVVLSDAKKKWTRSQLERLERICDQFDAYVAELNLRPQPLRHKLVGVLFEERRQYTEFARNHDRVRTSWNCGYYSPAADRLVLYHGEADEEADDYAAQRTVATTIHEAIHQLHYHTGLQNKHVQYPLWSGEGIATNFESASSRDPFGPAHEFSPRRRRFEDLLRSDRLLSLERLVALDHMPDQRPETVGTVYNQSYALVSWLAERRERELRDYLAKMRGESPGRPQARRHLELFTAAFGDVARLERAWLADERIRLDASATSRDHMKPLKSMAAGEPMEIVEVGHVQDDSWIDTLDRARGRVGLHHGAGVPGAEATQHGSGDARGTLDVHAGR